ncbi:MAG: sodium:calcium antiporter [Nitrososphaerota archaeon]|nr:sodium:calcium antiporter [Nitrososphaerota archaeon]MDG7024117.1 sodium:calcium antiporter [Nitrososphaerota archaeon]
MAGEDFAAMGFWLLELILASYLLSYGVEHLSKRYGGRFVGRTLMSVATTLPELAIVVYAAAEGSYGIALGSGLGSNLLMMTLGLALMLLIATTKLSRAPLKGLNMSGFGLDKLFLILTSMIGALLFIDGYNYIDGVVFSGLFVAYLVLAFRETRMERGSRGPEIIAGQGQPLRGPLGLNGDGPVRKASLIFLAGTLGIYLGAGPFIEALKGFAADTGVSAIVLAVIISPIAGEMPEKLSMVVLARKGEAGANIAVANVLGSKILNNTLLLAVAVFGAMAYGGFYSRIAPTPILTDQVVLVTLVTVLAIVPMFKKSVGLKTGASLFAMYVASILVQFQLPQGI